MKVNWKVRLSNKAFWVALASAIILLCQQLGLKDVIPDNALEIVNSLLVIGTILGIVVDPTTDGLSDSQRVLNKDNEQV